MLEEYRGLVYGGDDHAFRFVDVPPDVLDVALGEFDQHWSGARHLLGGAALPGAFGWVVRRLLGARGCDVRSGGAGRRAGGGRGAAVARQTSVWEGNGRALLEPLPDLPVFGLWWD